MREVEQRWPIRPHRPQHDRHPPMGRHGRLGISTRQRRSASPIRPCRPAGRAVHRCHPAAGTRPTGSSARTLCGSSGDRSAGRHSPHLRVHQFFQERLQSRRCLAHCAGDRRPRFSIILDAFHNWNSNSTLADLRAIPLEQISHYHIDDAHPDIPPPNKRIRIASCSATAKSISPPNWRC